MLERYIEQHEAVTKTLSSSELRKNVKGIVTLSPDDVNELEAVLVVLAPLKTITTIMCDSKNPTIPLIFVFKMRIINAMMVTDSDSNIVISVKNAIRENMVKRYTGEEIEEFLCISTALDPRFRSLPDLNIEKRNEVYSKIITMAEMIDIQVKVKTEHAGQSELPSTSSAISTLQSLPSMPSLPSLPSLPVHPSLTSHPNLPGVTDENANKLITAAAVPCEPVKKRIKTGLEELLGDVYVTHTTPATSASELARLEVEKYRSQEASSLDTAPQDWWRQHQKEFPRLSKLGRRILHIPATSVPSERVFSIAGDIVTATRSRLSPDMVDTLVFLKHNT